MKPAAFEYARAESVEHAVALLAEGGGEAKVLAGGQSLVPLLNFRLLQPALLVDINRIEGLGEVEPHRGSGGAADRLRIGALARHRQVETSALVRARLPVLAEAARHVAHLGVRNRGTFGGSLAHADPAAEMPLLAVLLDATVHTAAPGGGRAIRAQELFAGPLETSLAPGEVVTHVDLPCPDRGSGWSFAEVARRAGDYAIAAVAVTLRLAGGRCAEVRIALGGVAETPLRAAAAEALLAGERPGAGVFAAAGASAAAAVDPPGDLHASAEYRRHVVEVLTRRGLAAAAARAGAARGDA